MHDDTPGGDCGTDNDDDDDDYGGCKFVSIIVVTTFQATVTMFSGHIIVAIFAEANSPLLGLRFPSEMQF